MLDAQITFSRLLTLILESPSCRHGRSHCDNRAALVRTSLRVRPCQTQGGRRRLPQLQHMQASSPPLQDYWMLSRRHGRRADTNGGNKRSVDFIAQFFKGTGSQSTGLG